MLSADLFPRQQSGLDMSKKRSVMVAGVGGASLGTEILKSLGLAKERYNVYCSDISPLAFGLYGANADESFLVPVKGYVTHLRDLCVRKNIEVVIPGGEQPLQLL